jgi:hypothetical protein
VYRQVLNYYSGEEDAFGARPSTETTHAAALCHSTEMRTHARTHARTRTPTRTARGEHARGARAVHMRSADASVRVHALLCLGGVADMRKAMPRDVLRKSVVPLKRPVQPWELEHD